MGRDRAERGTTDCLLGHFIHFFLLTIFSESRNFQILAMRTGGG